MSPFSFMVWLFFLVALLPAGLVYVGVAMVAPAASIWAAVLTFGFCFTQILDWAVAPKSGDK